jgi:uncharacterized protein (TIGR02391 family)
MASKKAQRERPKIAHQEVLSETGRRSYEMLRVSRVQYSGNPHTFIDIRLFLRGYDEDGEEIYFPTKRGVQLKEEQLQKLFGKWKVAPQLLLHPTILKKVTKSLEAEEYDTSVFRAFKEIEVRIRKACGYEDELIGVNLVRRAFDPIAGPLTNLKIPKSEREAISHLFSGAIGSYKNPLSHRDVELDFATTLQLLLLASHLMYHLDNCHSGPGHRKLPPSGRKS